MLGKTQMTLRGSDNSSTLIHEIVHQLMHDYLPIVPLWFSEGFSEYMNAAPYNKGHFDFKNIDSGLKEHLQKKYGARQGQIIRMTAPKDILEKWTKRWPASMESYRDSMLLFYYFMHLDQKDKSGAPIASFFNIVDQMDFDMEKFISEYTRAAEEFTKTREKFNGQVSIYNDELAKYKVAALEYNERLFRLNNEIATGVPEAKRTKLGAVPTQPIPPIQIVLPDILKNNRGGAPDVIKGINENARKALLRDRSYSDLEKSLIHNFAEMDISITIR